MSNKYEELEKLAKLKEQWILSEDEFNTEKNKILSSVNNSSSNNYSEMKTYFDNSEDNIFQKFLSHKWRINRGEYLIYLSISFIPILMLVLFSLIPQESQKWIIKFIWIWLIIYVFLWIYSLYILTIKKLHDIDTSWWMSIIVNILAPLSTFVLLFIPWTKWDNRFWPKKWEDKIWTSLFIVIWWIIILTILLWIGFNIQEEIQKKDNLWNIKNNIDNNLSENKEIEDILDNSFLSRTNYNLLWITKEDWYKKALEIIDNWINKFPNSSDLYTDKGDILLNSIKDYDNAIINYDKAIELDSSNYKAYHGKWLALSLLWKDNEAKNNLQKSYDLHPDEVVKSLIDSIIINDKIWDNWEWLIIDKKDWKYWFINKNWNLVIKHQYDDIWYAGFSEWLVAVQKNWKWGYIDKSWNVVIDFIYDYSNNMRFSEWLAPVKKDWKYWFINKNWNRVIDFIYDDVACCIGFYEWLIIVKKGWKWWKIDKSWNVVVDFIHNENNFF